MDCYSQLPHLYVFIQVVEQGSFQAAARYLGLPRSSVSKRISQLEQQLGLRLLQRSTRKLNLTNEGRAFLEASKPLMTTMQQITSLTQNIQLARGELTGKVVITSSTLLGERYLVPLLAKLHQHYPKVIIDVRLTDQVVDLIADGIDLALRIGNLPDSSLIARQVGEKRWGCFASPQLLTRQGAPETPHHLESFDCIILQTPTYRMDHWNFTDPDNGNSFSCKISESFTADDGRTLVSMASAGIGIVWGDPHWVRAETESGCLQEVLCRWRSESVSPIYWVSLGKQARNPAVEAVWSWLGEHLQQELLP